MGKWGKLFLFASGAVGTILLARRVRAAPGPPPPPPTIIYPVDDWTRATLPDGTVYEFRDPTLTVGWAGGLMMEKEEGVLRFSGLPAALSLATLVIVPTEYWVTRVGDETIVKADMQEVGRDNQTVLTPLRVDITPRVQGGGGELLVELSPTPVTGEVRNWLRKYGSVRGPEIARPRIEIR